MLLGCIADDFTGATDLANNLVRAGMRAVQTIGVPDGALAFVKYLGIDRLPNGKKNVRVEADCEPVLFGCIRAVDRWTENALGGIGLSA